MKPACKTLDDLLAVMAALRAPGTGCPWDLAQTFSTIAPYTIEEAYEVADAIARSQMHDLKDELGDLLLQVVYHARLAEEAKHFTFADVTDAITRKMIRRHPHVFGSPLERAAGAAPGFWDRIKAEERTARTVYTSKQNGVSAHASPSLLEDVPIGMPGLTRAIKLQNKAAGVGFDWPDIGPVFAKLAEEVAELQEAVSTSDHAKIEGELGDLLFVIANLARHLKIDPEAALRTTNQKFTERFAFIERALAASARTPAQSDLAEMDRLWDAAKAAEKTRAQNLQTEHPRADTDH